MKNAKPFLIVAGMGIIGYSLYKYYRKQLDFIKDITYKVIGVKIVSISKNLVSLDITAQIYNASNVEATVKQMYLDFFVNGVRVGNINEVKDILILPLKSTNVTFNFSFSPSLIGKNVAEILTATLGIKDIILDIKGFIKVRSAFIGATVPFEYQNNLKSLIGK